ncbi:MAG: type III-B CRISPR module RAMP protein Cmr1 [Candidatus Helarchaeota archaeon]
MEEITLELESVTPVFIAGADQRSIENEGLRAPSLRGAMRWWFRAVAGGVKFSYGDLDLNSVIKEEERIWGTDDKRSKVSLSVVSRNLNISTFQNVKKEGIRYLSYGLFKRPYTDLGSQFGIRILFRYIVSDEEKEKVIATLWLLLNLGNVGSKSRKGFGGLRVTNNVTISGIEFKNPSSLKELEEYLKNNLKECIRIFGWGGRTPMNKSLPKYPIIAPYYWKMKILYNTYNSAIDAINYIGKKIRKYREDRDNSSARPIRPTGKGTFLYWVTRDYSSVKSIYTKGSPSTPPGSIFGLPHQFQFRSINQKAVVKGTEHDRRASPLYIKIWKLGNNRFAVGLQLFKSLFLPENKLRISALQNPNIKADVNLPSYSYLENFLNQLSGRWITL